MLRCASHAHNRGAHTLKEGETHAYEHHQQKRIHKMLKNCVVRIQFEVWSEVFEEYMTLQWHGLETKVYCSLYPPHHDQ